MEAATEESTSLRIRRAFNQSAAAVYAAWTDPEKVKLWMRPPDGSIASEVSIDLRVGGRYRIVMHAPDGEVHRVGGVYQEVIPGRKLVYTWAFESTPERESRVVVEFRPVGKGSELVLTHDRFADRAARDNHLQGWTSCLNGLDAFLLS